MHTSMRNILLVALLFSPICFSQAAEEPNSLLGVFTEAPDYSKFKGAQMTVTGLNSSHPVVVWPDGYDSKMTTIFDNETLVILQFVASLGSTETIYIEKKNKKFVVVAAAAFTAVLPSGGVKISTYSGFIK